jgi:hypothetical protein
MPTKKTTEGTEAVGQSALDVAELQRIIYTIPIAGTAPLITQRWSEKARQMMLDAQQSSTRKKREAKDPEANFNAARYRLPDGRDGVPATAFKAAIVHAARLFDGITQVMLRQAVVVLGDDRDERGDALVAIDYDELRMREDTPRNASGVADLRYRPQYWPWRASLRVLTIEGQIKDEESIVRLVNAAGFGGVGEWRPTSPKSATGTYGTFEVAR